jgi:hypothetical protein
MTFTRADAVRVLLAKSLGKTEASAISTPARAGAKRVRKDSV